MAYVPDEAIDSSHEITHAAFKLYASYCRHRNNKPEHPHFGLAWPDRDTVHDETGICTTYISTLKAELLEKGWIETQKSKIRPLKGFRLEGEKSNGSTFKSDSSTFANSEGFNNPTTESNHSTQKSNDSTGESNGSTRILKVIEPANEPSKEPANEPPTRAPKNGASRGTRIPDPFLLTQTMRDWAKERAPDVDVKEATAEFVDYWRGVPGARGLKLDWEGTWRNRLRVLQEKAKATGSNRQSFASGRRSNVEKSMDAVKERLAEIEEEKRCQQIKTA
ncbi:MAG TPA: hypothetical protein VJS44_08225 [Pyrinomonadaceae bacterium]|nr:hypothetical protein [Pyrinomonadaceae bacterium]